MSDVDSLLEYNEIVVKMFNSEDEGFQFYKNYTYEKGFSVRKVYCEWDKDMDERNLRKFVCRVKVSAHRSTLGGRSSCGGRRMSLALVAMLNL
jgi:hypothetical protein